MNEKAGEDAGEYPGKKDNTLRKEENYGSYTE